jgi:hypothetical protein
MCAERERENHFFEETAAQKMKTQVALAPRAENSTRLHGLGENAISLVLAIKVCIRLSPAADAGKDFRENIPASRLLQRRRLIFLISRCIFH